MVTVSARRADSLVEVETMRDSEQDTPDAREAIPVRAESVVVTLTVLR